MAQVQPTSNQSVGTWPAILTIVLFFLSNIAVIFPLRLPVPFSISRAIRHALVSARVLPENPDEPQAAKRTYLHFNFITVPLISVLILLAAGVFDAGTLRDGIVGTGGVRPLNIMGLFISLAYISISLDATGLFRFLAFWVASRGGSSGRRLFTYLYVFFLLCGVIVGNDPVVLLGTPFLAYFTRVAGITPPTAWIFSQFAAANMASVVLVSANLTNLVLSEAFSLSFLAYAAHVVLPFLAAAVCVFPVLLFGLFRSPTLVPRRIDIGLDPNEVRATLVDRKGAIFGSALLVATLGVLVGVSTIGVPVWTVTVPPAVIMLLRDTYYDWSRRHLRTHPRSPTPSESPSPTIASGDIPLENVVSQKTAASLELREVHAPGTAPHDRIHGPPRTPSPHAAQSPRARKATPPPPRRGPALVPRLQAVHARVTATFPTVTYVAARLPVALLPFAFLMFILVQGLAAQGWVQVFARWWEAWVRRTGTLGAIGGMGFLSCMLCNFCGTNIGATILLARVLQVWIASGSSTENPQTHDGAIYALAVGSNFGAPTLTFSASLAGLLWRQILLQKGIQVRNSQFLIVNLPISFVAMLAASVVLVGQVYVEHPR
ncbi:hypothetical protein PYCCODRAFT_999447 [Trametes coccinea BRFM310]|uniref:Citrate transporter-like domain-containing protein n=1 Tax=Trametes coccinea (strain BRFM310) TaxID=1353009 RepID=A0A1Y2ID78_TRAC3|nr:hypothetical protein PYCCODRAFT_999447 [Trametes coccinea BRFM310]